MRYVERFIRRQFGDRDHLVYPETLFGIAILAAGIIIGIFVMCLGN